MLRQAARSIAVMLKYARAPALLSLFFQALQAAQPPLAGYFTGRTVNAISGYADGAGTPGGVAVAAAWLILALLAGIGAGMAEQLIDLLT
jgi:hypothetical protein